FPAVQVAARVDQVGDVNPPDRAVQLVFPGEQCETERGVREQITQQQQRTSTVSPGRAGWPQLDRRPAALLEENTSRRPSPGRFFSAFTASRQPFDQVYWPHSSPPTTGVRRGIPPPELLVRSPGRQSRASDRGP